MKTLSVHTAEELIGRWRLRAERWRSGYNDVSTAHAIDCCAVELEAILMAHMELEAAHHGDPEPSRSFSWSGRGGSGRDLDEPSRSILPVERHGEELDDLCQNPRHNHHRYASGPDCMDFRDDANALGEWARGERP
jgi:hypothetical protein